VEILEAMTRNFRWTRALRFFQVDKDFRVIRLVFCGERSVEARPAIFIDRDGVINRHRPNDYVLEWAQFDFIPGIIEGLRELYTLNLPMIVISNQAGVGNGLLDRSDLEDITARLQERLSASGVPLTAYYYCPHKRDEGCQCRKPKPGMLRSAAEDFNIDLRRSLFIGDSSTDIQAALAAGCRPILFGAGIRSGSASEDCFANLPVARTARDLFTVAKDCLTAEVAVLSVVDKTSGEGA
jgi:D-glycero-D-manno-heptose 1,7-bisphosphate phosphatase